MALLIPDAIGLCNLTEEQTWTMTPAEIMAKIEAKAGDRLDLLRSFDQLHADLLTFYVSAHGVKDATRDNYLIFGKGDGESAPDMTPEAIMDRAFENLVKVSG